MIDIKRVCFDIITLWDATKSNKTERLGLISRIFHSHIMI